MVGKFSLFEIASYEKGLLFYYGIFQELLVSGKYYFWKSSISITLQKVDMRQLQLDISGQEIMKTILNQVLEAEKKAQANLIMRREETASTRSLLNTVKIMENNPILLRLKELEYIEKICSKIDKVNLLGVGNLLDQFGNLFISKEKN